MQLTVVSSLCPLTRKITYALYEGELPVVPATVFLRDLVANADLDSNTLSTYAYALKAFFVFLQENGTSFWNIKVAHIKQFKRFYLGRRNESGELAIKRQTAQQYLRAIKSLIHFWRGQKDGDPLFINHETERDGAQRYRHKGLKPLHASWYSRIPNTLWTIKIPQGEKHNKQRYKGLSGESCRQVMITLNRIRHSTDIQTMLYYRDRAVWTFLLMTGLRKGELCRIRLEDINQALGLVILQDRPEDSRLGDLKSGPAEIFVTPQNPYWKYLDSWLLEGRWIAEELLRNEGKEDHHLLFCNRDGGPMTQAAVNHLFLQIRKGCGFGAEMPFHPHVTRHTVATLMINKGLDSLQVQKFLRHRSALSTEIYTKVSDPNYRKAMEKFWNECGVLA